MQMENGVLVVHMHPRLELQRWQHGGIDIHQLPFGMGGEQMPAADLAPLAQAVGGLVIFAHMLLTLGDFHRFRRLQAEGIHRPG